jgi:coatomer protein complex subunit gamma
MCIVSCCASTLNSIVCFTLQACSINVSCSHFCHCQIRIACKLLEEEDSAGGGSSDSPLFEFIESCLRHKSEMVIYEAAHAIVNLRRTTSRELAPAVSVLQLFCSSPKPTLRFAAVRTLNKVQLCRVQ